MLTSSLKHLRQYTFPTIKRTCFERGYSGSLDHLLDKCLDEPDANERVRIYQLECSQRKTCNANPINDYDINNVQQVLSMTSSFRSSVLVVSHSQVPLRHEIPFTTPSCSLRYRQLIA